MESLKQKKNYYLTLKEIRIESLEKKKNYYLTLEKSLNSTEYLNEDIIVTNSLSRVWNNEDLIEYIVVFGVNIVTILYFVSKFLHKTSQKLFQKFLPKRGDDVKCKYVSIHYGGIKVRLEDLGLIALVVDLSERKLKALNCTRDDVKMQKLKQKILNVYKNPDLFLKVLVIHTSNINTYKICIDVVSLDHKIIEK